MVRILIPVLLVLLIYAPYFYVRYVYQSNNKTLKLMPFDGREFAKKILKENNLNDIKINPQDQSLQNFYDPINRSIGIEKKLLENRSLTSISIIAHEVGHAIQHKENYQPLLTRHILLEKSNIFRSIGSSIVTLGLGPIFAFTQSIYLTLIASLVALLFFCFEIFINIFTLRCEYDASFNRAMPLLKKYIPKEYMDACKQVLNAAALTYIANSILRIISFRNFFYIFIRLLKK